MYASMVSNQPSRLSRRLANRAFHAPPCNAVRTLPLSTDLIMAVRNAPPFGLRRDVAGSFAIYVLVRQRSTVLPFLESGSTKIPRMGGIYSPLRICSAYNHTSHSALGSTIVVSVFQSIVTLLIPYALYLIRRGKLLGLLLDLFRHP